VEHDQGDEVFLKEFELSQLYPDEGICSSIHLKVLVNVLQRFQAVLMLDVYLEAVDVLVGTDSLDTEQQIIEFSIELPLINGELVLFSLVVLETRIVVILIDVLHGIIYVLLLVQIGGINAHLNSYNYI